MFNINIIYSITIESLLFFSIRTNKIVNLVYIQLKQNLYRSSCIDSMEKGK